MDTRATSLPKVYICPKLYGVSRANEIALAEARNTLNVRFAVGLDALNDERPQAERVATRSLRLHLREKYRKAEVQGADGRKTSEDSRKTNEDVLAQQEHDSPVRTDFPNVDAEVVAVPPEVLEQLKEDEV